MCSSWNIYWLYHILYYFGEFFTHAGLQHWHGENDHNHGKSQHNHNPNRVQDMDQSVLNPYITTGAHLPVSNTLITEEDVQVDKKSDSNLKDHHKNDNKNGHKDHKHNNQHFHEHKSKQNHEHQTPHDHEKDHKHQLKKVESQVHDHHHHNELNPQTTSQIKDEDNNCLQNLKGKGTAGYMNLLGSIIHNFMDGLALGVAFATGDPKAFIPILIAIIAHEIPREMGDVAILMTNNFNPTQTVLCNGFVNLLALLGVIVGLAITDLSELAKEYILVFVAGNFIFIAADIWKHLFKNSSLSKNLVEFSGFGLGLAAMYLVLLLQNQ